ncbi:MAG: pirin family protein [Candidatus Marinimicrobia bacterium]|nr:pirin family protein [Candidatus Neomarinimicrobiota bacterium]MCF7904222.1 pirin family protein [Candidatus Neomarinimicrobiota bacterium]
MNSGTSPIININKLDFTWATRDPFLFCVHHRDQYPAGEAYLGPPATALKGRNIGQDFTLKDGWRMYHGDRVPGFPAHPHRGFETVTIVLNGYVDHSDSHGASGRYGEGDVQWMTAGSGLQHAEMFPLLNQDTPNTGELFQVWLNLPEKNKMVDPFYKMLWSEDIPTHKANGAHVRIIAGTFQGLTPPPPAPDSWARDPENEVSIWIITLEPNANWVLPATHPGLNRSLYFYQGSDITIAGKDIGVSHSLDLKPEAEVDFKNGKEEACLLLLQAKPIGEPVAQYGPFVMNRRVELEQAFSDYQKTQFGGWPWSRNDPVHGPKKRRFARFADGSEEIPS